MGVCILMMSSQSIVVPPPIQIQPFSSIFMKSKIACHINALKKRL